MSERYKKLYSILLTSFIRAILITVFFVVSSKCVFKKVTEQINVKSNRATKCNSIMSYSLPMPYSVHRLLSNYRPTSGNNDVVTSIYGVVAKTQRLACAVTGTSWVWR